MRSVRKKYLSYLPIEENIFKADFHILEKYQGVSAEILKLSLIGLAVYGFMITNVIFKVNDPSVIRPLLDAFVAKKMQLTAGGVLLLLSAVFALAHRYFSTDSLSHHIRGIRMRQKWHDLMQLAAEKDLTIEKPQYAYKKSELDLKPDNQLTSDEICFWIDYLKTTMKKENDSLEADFDRCLILFVGAASALIAGIGLALWSFMSFLTEIKL